MSDRRFGWATDNPLVRAVGRVPLRLGAKLIAGFGLIAALLAVGYALGFLALQQSNSRGEQLRVLQQQTAFEQRLLTDATEIRSSLASLRHYAASQSIGVAAEAVALAGASLCRDAGGRLTPGSFACFFGARKGLALRSIDPPLWRKVVSATDAFGNLSTGPNGSAAVASNVAYDYAIATALVPRLSRLANSTQDRANALVAQNHSSYASSRNLLIGVGAGTLLLVLGLGLLLSSSIVVPLRRTRTRLAEISAGDFSSQVEVSNRDELGGLADDVNRMNDELKRLYGELEMASRHKSDFLATMSHELRTPLNAIIGFSEVLQEQMFGELNERQLAYVNDVLEAGKHLLSLINDVLDLAKIEAGRMELELSELAIPHVLRGAVSLHAEQANRGGVQFEITSEPEEIMVTADERRVRQVVLNLISNAVKFTPAGGRVDVSARLDHGHVEIAVADTGPGLSAEELDSIFEEFEQTAAGKQAEGTGLGLPLSRKLVELHGGRLWAESEPGRGSTFRFTLPIRAET